MSEVYAGLIKELGGKEMSKDGTKEKPRKVVISDSPDYQGKTFRCWPDSEAWSLITKAFSDGVAVRVDYEINPIPDTDYKQNMVTGASLNNGQEQLVKENWTPPDYGGHRSSDKDALITATAIVKSLTEGRYLTRENLESGEFKWLVGELVKLVHEVAG